MSRKYLSQLSHLACVVVVFVTLISAQSSVTAQPPHADIPMGQQTCNQLEITFVSAFTGGGVMGETAYGIRSMAILKGCPWAT